MAFFEGPLSRQVDQVTESGFQPIGVAVICFSLKPPAKGIKGYRVFAAPVFELPQVVLIVKTEGFSSQAFSQLRIYIKYTTKMQ